MNDSMYSKVGNVHWTANTEFDFIEKWIELRAGYWLTSWPHYFLGIQRPVNYSLHKEFLFQLVNKAKGRQIFDKSILMENVKPL